MVYWITATRLLKSVYGAHGVYARTIETRDIAFIDCGLSENLFRTCVELSEIVKELEKTLSLVW